MNYVHVILPLAIADTYTYRIPDTMPCPEVGMRVLVPLARKQLIGIVWSVDATTDVDESKLRDILLVPDSLPVVQSSQLRLWRWMADYYMCSIGEVMAAALPAKLHDIHYVLGDNPRRRVKLSEYTSSPVEPNPLDKQQSEALAQICDEWSSKDVVLLHGVTSSGKTEVYTHLIREQLAMGKQVLYLVPEIALTTQLTDRLQAVFGNQLVVYHSRVTDAQRVEIYRQLLSTTEPRLILGARSAVFLPVDKVGLIIVDEEHEPSYKQQDPAPRYHARSTAIMLARQLNAKVLLGTATPSVETYYNALSGKYGLVRMPNRYQNLLLPRITMIDLQRQYHRKEMYGHFSDPLVDRIRQELALGKQVILFQNRRGYAAYLQCTGCGYVPHCPDCDVPTTYHRMPDSLTCHYCGHTQIPFTTCPQCGGEMKVHGFGTERLEDEVAQYFPEARVDRLDLDSTRTQHAYQNIINRFANHEIDILIGTQMVTKGLHFNDVSLVAVLNADSLLNQPDFRSYERTFQMLEQVAGRAGRTGQQGEMILQTFDPKHTVYSRVMNHDHEGIYASEIAEREAFRYPPFVRLITITLRHRQEDRVESAGQLLQQQLRAVFGSRCSALLTPSISRVKNLFARQLQLRIEANANITYAKQLILEQIHYVESLPSTKSVVITPDVDPL